MAAVALDVGMAPDMHAAQRAAEACGGAGVARVLLYGSVARGSRHRTSDIDLVAIFDDLDYAERPRKRSRLERLATEACGHPVDVHVTDRTEWAIRTNRVPCSFENRIAAETLVVYDHGGHSPIAWDKEIGLPATPAQELASRYQNMTAAVARLS